MKTKIVYVAADGKEFTDQEQCKEWEKGMFLRAAFTNWEFKAKQMGVNWKETLATYLLTNFHIAPKCPNNQSPHSSTTSGTDS